MAAAVEGSGKPKVLITGASGLLGRALFRELSSVDGLEVLGTAFSRASDVLRKVDLTDPAAVAALLREERPAVLIHAAAERRPDVCEGDADATRKLNVECVRTIAEVCDEIGCWVLAISTDYVFDGTSPPYKVTDEPAPLNAYGVSKREGEVALLASNSSAAVLRVPVLFGPTKSLAESAITIIARAVLDSSKPSKVDHWAVRYPTYTPDVASVIRGLVQKRLDAATPEDKSQLSGVLHWSGSEAFSKFEMAQVIGECLSVDTSHLSPNHEPPSGAPRPKNCQMDVSVLDDLGVGVHTPFAEAIASVLKECVAEGKEVEV